MRRTGQMLLSAFAVALCWTAQADAQRDPPKYEPRPLRFVEHGGSDFQSSIEEWNCPAPSGDTRLKFSITTKHPAVARVFLNDKELDAKIVNDLLYNEVRAGDIIRIDLTTCRDAAWGVDMTFVVHYGTFPADPSYPLGIFKIGPDGVITLVDRDPWPTKR